MFHVKHFWECVLCQWAFVGYRETSWGGGRKSLKVSASAGVVG